VPLGRGEKHAVGGRVPLMTPQGLRRGGEISPEMPIVLEASSQGSGEIEFVVCAFERLTHYQCFLDPLWWAYKHAGCHILPPVGYLGYFDTRS
jgi:hypothetical protein